MTELGRRNKRAGITNKSKIPITIVLKSSEKDFLEKKAKKDGLSLYMEIKKKLIDSIPASSIPPGVYRSQTIRKKIQHS